MTNDQKNEIKKAFDNMKNREIKNSIREELAQVDRVYFDREVLKAFGLEQYYEQIVEALLELHSIRSCVKE